jgi:oxygen-dependent protoporphyrinogen oxidase
MFAFKNGMQVFPQALGNALATRVITGSHVQHISEVRKRGLTTYEISGTKKGKKFALKCDAVITAIPSYTAAPLVAPFDATLCKSLKDIYYPPVVEIFLGFKSSDIGRALDGFGFLVPAKEKRRILGTIWSSSLFPGRAPAGYAALTTFVGGSRQPEITEESDDRIVEIVTEELSSILGVSARPVFRRIARWKHAIPQYNLGHLAIVSQMEGFEKEHPGFFISGNFRGGISVGDCIISSEKTAARVQDFLRDH